VLENGLITPRVIRSISVERFVKMPKSLYLRRTSNSSNAERCKASLTAHPRRMNVNTLAAGVPALVDTPVDVSKPEKPKRKRRLTGRASVW